MASRTLFSTSSLIKTVVSNTEKNMMVKSTVSHQTATTRQATTTTILRDTSTTQGRVPATNTRFHFYDYVSANKNHQQEVNLVKFTSVEGKRLFRNAMVQGYAESFFNLMGNFSNQSSPSHGGVSSLAMVLNALEIDPERIWKGNWRWFSSDQMKTCSPSESIKQRGIPFDEFTCLAQAYCQVKPYRGVSYQDFLKHLVLVTSDTSSQMVVHYSRKSLGQHDRLAAHFSPIGGYNKIEDQVLIMDVARGKYPSVWVNTKVLYNAMMVTSQEESGRSRGYFILSHHHEQPAASSIKLKCRDCTRNCHSTA